MNPYQLNDPIIKFNSSSQLPGQNSEDVIDLATCMQSFHICGTVGSGKSSGSASFLALNFLLHDFGGIVLTAKTEERKVWEDLCKATGRSDKLVIFGEDKDYKFDPIQYQSKDTRSGATTNLVSLILSLSAVGNRVTGSTGEGGDPFWMNATKRLLSNVIDVLKLANEEVSFLSIDEMVRACALYAKHKADSKNGVSPLDYVYLIESLKRISISVFDPKKIKLSKVVRNYFLKDFPSIPERTRESILETLRSTVNLFLSGVLEEYFTGGVSPAIIPEKTYEEGKIILIDFSVKDYHEIGAIAQTIYLTMFQRTVEKRNINNNRRPVFLFIDEAQYFLNDSMYLFLTTSRSKRCSTVMITQTISNYLAILGTGKGKAKVDSLMSNLVTKIIHASNDTVSCKYFSDMIGKHYARVQDSAETNGIRTVYQYLVEPTEFAKLRTGTDKNKGIVEAYILTLNAWSNGKRHQKFSFDQNIVKRLIEKRKNE